MAKHRMFTLDVVDSDEFFDLSPNAQTLYFHIGMRADDDGVSNNYRRIMKLCGATEEDLIQLIRKKFIIPLQAGESQIMVIKHWRMHNYIPKDRYNRSKYGDIIECLDRDENQSYKLPDTGCIRAVYEMYTACIQSVDSPNTQVKVSKDNINYPIIAASQHGKRAMRTLSISGLTKEALEEADEDGTEMIMDFK